MEQDQIQKLRRFLEGKSNPSEAHEVISWMNTPAAKKMIGDRFVKFDNHEGYDFQSRETFDEILKRIEVQELLAQVEDTLIESKHVSMLQSNGYSNIRLRAFLKVAASISIIVLTFLGGYYLNGSWDDQEPVVSRMENFSYKSADKGQKLTFHLSDGTMVKLNSNSRLRFSSLYDDQLREVWLEGEAFFEVTEDPEKPFVVRTNKISTTALGTSFTVRATAPEKHEVFLLTGKVNVALNENPGLNEVLLPGETAIYDTKTADPLSKGSFDPEQETAWKDGILIFNRTPFEEVIEKIELWYGVDIEVNGKIPNDLYASSKFQNDYLKEVMRSLAYSWGFEFDILERKNKVVIKF